MVSTNCVLAQAPGAAAGVDFMVSFSSLHCMPVGARAINGHETASVPTSWHDQRVVSFFAKDVTPKV